MRRVDISVNESKNDINIIVDNNSPNLQQFYSILKDISILCSLSSKSLETHQEVDTMQESLTAKWHETYQEVNTMQESLTAGWEATYLFQNKGIVDGGTF
jgi:hypothetical protein